MRTYRMYQVDSFTTEKFRGNPAGVVMNADGLSEHEMLMIARELHNSETAFIFSPDDPDHDIQIRYFTPTVEVPICGHATIAAHYVRALEQQLESTIVMQKTKIGTLPVEVVKRDHGSYVITMTQGAIEFREPIVGCQRSALITAIGITDKDIDECCPVQIVSTGHGKVMIGITSRDKLDSLAPDMLLLKQLSDDISCNGYFVFAMDTHIPGVFSHARMFAPVSGVPEDPVTGNAYGPLGAYLIRHRLVNHDGNFFRFTGEQGSAIGRSGFIDVQVKIEGNEPVQVKIGGEAVIAFQTEITL